MTAAKLDDRDPGADLEQRHQHQRNRPRRGADLVGHAEARDCVTRAVVDREHEHHPRADPGDQQRAGDPADACDGETVLARADVGGEAARDTEREADGPERGDQHQVVAGGRDRVHVDMRDVRDDRQRDDEAATVELSLAGLTQDDQDEHCVDEVIGDCHGRHDLLAAPACRRPEGWTAG